MDGENGPAQRWELLALAEKVQQWNDVEDFLRELAGASTALTPEDVVQLCAYHALCTAVRRSEWRGLMKWEHSSLEETAALQALQSRLAGPLEAWYANVDATAQQLLALTDSPRAQLHLRKMRADHLRYRFEDFRGRCMDGGQREAALGEYQRALSEAEATLPAVDALRLSLALNAAVALYVLAGRPAQATAQVEGALGAALAHADDIPKDSFRATAALLQSMRDNAALWSDKS